MSRSVARGARVTGVPLFIGTRVKVGALDVGNGGSMDSGPTERGSSGRAAVSSSVSARLNLGYG